LIISKTDANDTPISLVQGSYSMTDAFLYFAELKAGDYMIFVHAAGVTAPGIGKLSVTFSLSSFGKVSFIGYDIEFNTVRHLALKEIKKNYSSLYED